MQKLTRVILKSTLFPASLMIVSKIVGLVLVSTIFGLNIYIENNANQLFSVNLYLLNQDKTILANSFSNILMLTTMAIGFAIYYFRYKAYQNTISNPRTIIKLLKLNILGWVTTNNGGIISSVVWGVFLWITCILIIINSTQMYSYNWIGYISSIILISSFWLVIQLIETEIKHAFPEDTFLY